MPNYRRAHVPGGTFFFTVVTHLRRPLFHLPHNQTLLGEAIRECRQNWPFQIDAIVLLPDHLHTIWTLPPGDDNFSARWSVIKAGFTTRFLSEGGADGFTTAGQRREHRRGVWQPRFWEHTIQDEDDYSIHMDYIHYNPVKHQLARCPRDWAPSSFHRWAERGVYPADWGCNALPAPLLPASPDDYGEPSETLQP